MSINIPPLLGSAENAFGFIKMIKDIISLDSKAIKEIEANIKNFNTLNDTQKKKEEEARKLIVHYEELKQSTDSSLEALRLHEERLLKEHKEFTLTRQTYLDDIANRNAEVDKYKHEVEKEEEKLKEIKRQLSVGQAANEAIGSTLSQKEISLNKKEETLNTKESTLIKRENVIEKKETEIEEKMTQLKKIIA